jgi:hypothetical protein
MKRTIKLTEKDINNLVKKVIEEQHGGGPWFGRAPGPATVGYREVKKPVMMDGSLFANGIDKIDTNSQQFQKGVDAIKNASSKIKNLEVTVQGGASAVGNQSGYDNKSLATRRSSNFIKAIKPIFPNVTFSVGAPIVGVATTKNSPEANAEQFVKLSFNTMGDEMYQIPAVDNTANVVRNLGINRKLVTPPKPNENMVTKCVKIPESQVALFQSVVSSLGLKIS